MTGSVCCTRTVVMGVHSGRHRTSDPAPDNPGKISEAKLCETDNGLGAVSDEAVPTCRLLPLIWAKIIAAAQKLRCKRKALGHWPEESQAMCPANGSNRGKHPDAGRSLAPRHGVTQAQVANPCDLVQECTIIVHF